MTGGTLRVVVVGSGPNGLTAAAVLTSAGADVTVLEAADTIGGGTRTSDLTDEGLLHDHCSAVHPLAAGSPGLQALDLVRYGLTWCQPEVDLVHPLDDGSAGVLVKDLAGTAGLLGADGQRWARLMRPCADNLPFVVSPTAGSRSTRHALSGCPAGGPAVGDGHGRARGFVSARPSPHRPRRR